MGRGGGTGQMPALASEPPAARRVRASWPAAACLPASVPFCHSGFVLLSHSISVTSCPPLICHGKDFKYRLALGDSDTYQWIQVSTHDQSSLKLSHLPNDSAVSPPQSRDLSPHGTCKNVTRAADTEGLSWGGLFTPHVTTLRSRVVTIFVGPDNCPRPHGW